MSTTLTRPTTSLFDDIRRADDRWSARDLMPLLGYEKWERFADAIDRAQISIANAGGDPTAEASRLREPSGATRQMREDFSLSRYACYVVAMNGDVRKPEVAAAQTYFAVRARQAEVAAPALPTDYASALRALLVEVEAKNELEAKVATDAPKVEYVETYVADADLLTFRTLASNLNVGEHWLRDLLIDAGWIYVQESTRWSNTKKAKENVRRYSAYAAHRHHFEAKPNHEAPRFRGEVMHTLKVTPAGAAAIARLVRRQEATS